MTPNRKKLQLPDSIEQYREVLEEMDDIILIVTDQGVIEYVNRALRKNLGTKGKRYTGRYIGDCQLFDRTVTKKEIMRKLNKERDFVTELHGKGKSVKHLAWKTKPFKQNGVKKLLAIIRDITAQVEMRERAEAYNKNLQEMVYQRTQQLEQEKKSAVELHQAKAIFLSKMSHELRTPLTAICGYAELLQEPKLDETDKKKYLGVVEKNARGLLEMITETLDMIRLEENKYQIKEKAVDLNKLIHEVVETYSILAEEKGLKLNYTLTDPLPEKISTDPAAIRQILTNLIGNAIKFTKKGSITVSVKTRSFSGKLKKKKVYMYIEDTGVGIPKEFQHRVFRTFEQYMDNQSVHHRGTGLGLPISKQLAKLLGGNVRLLASEPQRGSTFVFSMPLRTV